MHVEMENVIKKLEQYIKDDEVTYEFDDAIEELKQVYPHFYISNDFENKRIQRLEEASNMTTMLEDNNDFYYDSDYFENKTNEKYNGFYAQDEMGYNDDEIDTIFDGNPDAYWNID